MSPVESSGASGPKLSHMVELSFAADSDLVMLARLVAAAAASKVGFGIEQVEDVRLAVDELCLALIREHSAEGRLQLAYAWSDDTVEVVAAHVLGPGAPAGTAGRRQPDEELSSMILDALVDEHGVEDSSGTPKAWLRVRRARQA
jgi:anti-sigma regulatory factor (Ser/Thr protein kinase)